MDKEVNYHTFQRLMADPEKWAQVQDPNSEGHAIYQGMLTELARFVDSLCGSGAGSGGPVRARRVDGRGTEAQTGGAVRGCKPWRWWLFSLQTLLQSAAAKQMGRDDGPLSMVLGKREDDPLRRKIEAVIHNARCFQKIRAEFGTFSDYIWNFTKGKTYFYMATREEMFQQKKPV